MGSSKGISSTVLTDKGGGWHGSIAQWSVAPAIMIAWVRILVLPPPCSIPLDNF